MLLSSTVRAATVASFAGVKSGLVSAEVASLVLAVVKAMFLRRIATAATLVVLCGIGATAIATQRLDPARPEALGNPGSRALASDGSMAPFGGTERPHNANLVGVSFSASDNAVVTTEAGGMVRFWSPATGQHIRTVDLMETIPRLASIRRLALSADGRSMAAAGFVHDAASSVNRVGAAWIWNVSNARLMRTIAADFIDLHCLAFAPDGSTIATGASAGEVKLWDVATGDCQKTATLAANQSVFSLTFAADGKTLATIEQGRGIKLWDLEREEITLISIPLIGGGIAYFSGDGRYLAASIFDEALRTWDNVVIWDRQRGQEHLTARGSAQGFVPDSQSMAVLDSDGTLAIVSTETGERLWKAELGPGLRPAGVAFSPDGKTLVVGGHNVLRFFEAATGRERFASRGTRADETNLTDVTIGMRSVQTWNRRERQ